AALGFGVGVGIWDLSFALGGTSAPPFFLPRTLPLSFSPSMPDPVSVRQLIPTFHVKDVQKAAEWYRDRMGWEIQFVAAPDYAGVKIGDQVLHLAQWQKPGEMPPCQAYVMLTGGVDEYAK